MPRKFRTTTSGIPSSSSSSSVTISTPNKKAKQNGNGAENGSVNGNNKEKETESMGSLLTRQALKTYETANHMILYKYAAYGGTCGDLPK